MSQYRASISISKHKTYLLYICAISRPSTRRHESESLQYRRSTALFQFPRLAVALILLKTQAFVNLWQACEATFTPEVKSHRIPCHAVGQHRKTLTMIQSQQDLRRQNLLFTYQFMFSYCCMKMKVSTAAQRCTSGFKRMPMIPPVFASYLFVIKSCALEWINHLRSISVLTHSLNWKV